MLKILARVCFTIWYLLKYEVYMRIFQPELYKVICESNDELLGAIGWIDLDV
jgi:hypothetical protein